MGPHGLRGGGMWRVPQSHDGHTTDPFSIIEGTLLLRPGGCTIEGLFCHKNWDNFLSHTKLTPLSSPLPHFAELGRGDES